MRVLPALALAFLLSVGVVNAATPMVYDSTPSPPGDAHWVASSEKTLNEAQLAGASVESMLASGDQVATISVSKPSVGTPTLELRYSTDGASPSGTWVPMTPSGSSSSTLSYRRNLTPADLGTAAGAERTIRIQFRITNGDYTLLDDNAGSDYRYLGDSRPPMVGAMTINGAPAFNASSSDPATFTVPASDASAITEATLTIQNAGTSHDYPLGLSGTSASKSFPSGLALPDGDYTVRTRFVDSHGLVRATNHGMIVHLAAPPPPPPPPLPPPPPPEPVAPQLSDARFNGVPSISLGAATPFTATVQVSSNSTPAVSLRLLKHGLLSLETTLTRHDGATFAVTKPDGLQLPDGTYDAVFVATADNRTGYLQLPNAVTLDSTAPTPLGFTINGDTSLEATAATPIHLRLTVDGNPTQAAVHFLNDAATPVASYDLARGGDGSFVKDIPNGVRLPDGRYRARIVLTDSAGNEAATTLAHAPLMVDSTDPIIGIQARQFPDGQAALKQGDSMVLVVRVEDLGTITGVDFTGDSERAMTSLGGGLYQATFVAGPGNGVQQLRVLAHDASGHTGSLVVPVTFDNRPPTILSTEVRYPGPLSSIRPGEAAHVTILTSDQDSSVTRVYIEASELNPHAAFLEAIAKPATNRYEADLTADAPPGHYEIPVAIFDAAGNQARGTVNIEVRPDGPAVTRVLVQGARTYASREPEPFQLDVEATGVDREARYAILQNGVEAATGRLEPGDAGHYRAKVTARLGLGAYDLVVTAKDSQGRTTTWASPGPAVFVDPDPPQITAFYADTGRQSNSTIGLFGDMVRLRAVAQDLSPVVASMAMYTPSGGRVPLNLTQVLDGEWRTNATFLETGLFTATMTLTDLAGNTASQSTQFRLSPKSPTQPGSVQALHRTSPPNSPFVVLRWEAPAQGGPVKAYEVQLDGELKRQANAFQTAWTASTALAGGKHTILVAALNEDGNWGPAATLTFTVGNGIEDHVDLEDASLTPILAPVKVPSAARQLPVLEWAIRGRAEALRTVACIELEWRQGLGGYSILDPCAVSGTGLTASLDIEEGSAVTFRGRTMTKSGEAGDWVTFGTMLLDRTAPTISNLTIVGDLAAGMSAIVDVTIHDASSTHATLEVYRDGNLSQTLRLSVVEGTTRTTIPPLLNGSYSLRLVAGDAAGNEAALAGPTFTVGSVARMPAVPQDDGPGLKVAAILLVPVAAIGFWLLRRRQKRRQATPAETPPLLVHVNGAPVLLPATVVPAALAEGHVELGQDSDAQRI